MRTIHLTKGYVTMVDDTDYEAMNAFFWQVHPNLRGNTCYAYRVVGSVRTGRHGVSMHRAILNAPADLFVDHIDRNGLNNQRSNLRLCDKWHNRANKAPRAQSRLGYKGVAILTHDRHRTKMFQARITAHGQFYYLGNYDTVEEAARAYDAKALELFGEFAYLNFPSDAGKVRDAANGE